MHLRSRRSPLFFVFAIRILQVPSSMKSIQASGPMVQRPGSYKTNPWRVAFPIPNGFKKEIRVILRRLGTNKSSLFPDLAALAEELKSRSFV